MTIVKLGYPGGAEYSFNGLLLLLLTIVGCGLMVSLFVEKAFGACDPDTKTCDTPAMIMIFSKCPTCPSMEELIPWDNSFQAISGKFLNDTGSYSREAPYYEHHLKWYSINADDTVIFVELKTNLYDKAKTQQITIVDDFSIIPKNQDIVNGTTYHYENRMTFDSCKRATIAVTDWENLLQDTITYMVNQCDEEFTNIQTVFYDQIQEYPKTAEPTYSPWVHHRILDIGEYCRDKYPCAWEWNAPEWVKKVGVWHEERMITHMEYDRILAWLWEKEIINQIPPH